MHRVGRQLLRETIAKTVEAVITDLRADFVHGGTGRREDGFEGLAKTALEFYQESASGNAQERISHSGCYSMSHGDFLGILRSMNIPGHESTAGDYVYRVHSAAVLPCLDDVSRTETTL